MLRFRCLTCQVATSARFDHCPRCHMWNTCGRIGGNGASSIPGGGLISLRDVQALEPPRHRTVKEWDTAFGGPKTPGLAYGSRSFVWGLPGAGKSTEMLRLLAHAGGIYIETERRDGGGMLKRNVDNASVVLSDDRVQLHEAETPESACLYLSSHAWPIAVVDSLQGFDHDGSGGAKMLKRIANELASASHRDTSLILIGHATRDGTMAGPGWLAHLVDTIVRVGAKKLLVSKNRFGPMPLSVARKSRRLELVAS